MKIGVISDTHGWLDPRVEKLFAGVEHILHAGDIGDPMIELELKFIAPVTAVLGNTDLGLPFPLTETVELAQKTGLHVIASGGVSSYDDLVMLHESQHVAGAILGTALYEGLIDLAEAIRLSGEEIR